MDKMKDIKLISLGVILVSFTFVYFFSVNKISYAFESDYDVSKLHDKKIETVLACAKKYGESNNDLFSSEDTAYIKVSDLIEANLIATNENGNVKDPSSNKVIDNMVIKLNKLEDNKISVEVNG